MRALSWFLVVLLALGLAFGLTLSSCGGGGGGGNDDDDDDTDDDADDDVDDDADDDLNDVIVWVFHGMIVNEEAVDQAAYVNPQFVKRGWFRYSELPYDVFADPAYDFQSLPPLLNEKGILLEGGVQVAHIQQDTGWPCDSEYDEDHQPPYEVPDPVFYDFATRNADGDIAWLGEYEYPKCNASIANENWRDFVLYWAYEQIDASVNALEFDQIDAGYRMSDAGVPGDNSNDGYDDYAIGTANFATRLSMSFGHGMIDPIQWFAPTSSASSEAQPAGNAFDDDPGTFWESAPGSDHWIEMDLGRLRTVQQIYLNLHPEHVLENFQVQYWSDTTGWTDFSPPVAATGNTETALSFLVEPTETAKVRLSSTDNEVYLPELQLFGQGFRQFLLEKYARMGWSPADARWESDKLVNLSDPAQCPDGTMSTFNYREYLKYHGWTGNPFGCEITEDNFLDPENPLFFEWFPRNYMVCLFVYFYNDPAMLDAIDELYAESYSGKRVYELFWDAVIEKVRNYASGKGRKVYITYNGSAFMPHDVDYLLMPIGGGLGLQATYPAPSGADPKKTHLDGTQVLLNQWRQMKQRGVDYLGREVPLVAFSDFGDYFPFAHIGGVNEPANERAEFLRIYPMEMHAAGVSYCFPVVEMYENAWEDTASDGTPLIEIIKRLTDFLNAHADIYRDVTVNAQEGNVTVNGVVPFNGEWNLEGNRMDSPANESKVSIAYTDSADGTRSYLHIINHDWDDASHRVIPQAEVPVCIPQCGDCIGVSVVSPDFEGEVDLAHTLEEGVLSFEVPRLSYYDVCVIKRGGE